MKDRRHIKNFIIDTHAQLRFFWPFGILLGISLLTNCIMIMQITNIQVQIRDVIQPANFGLLPLLNQLTMKVVLTATMGIVFSSAFATVLWIIYSHRIFGPMVPIRRRLTELNAGDTTGTDIHLRPRDEFKDVAGLLNDLTKQMKK